MCGGLHHSRQNEQLAIGKSDFVAKIFTAGQTSVLCSGCFGGVEPHLENAPGGPRVDLCCVCHTRRLIMRALDESI